jgi:hypothetical protein
MGEKILRYLVDVGNPFVPERFDGGSLTGDKKVPFDPSNLDLPLKGWTDHQYSLGIIAERLRPIKVILHVSSTRSSMFDHLWLYVCLDKGGKLDSRRVAAFDRYMGVDRFLNVAKQLYAIIGANWGSIRNDFNEHNFGDVLDSQGTVIANSPPTVRWALRGLFWANFFGPEYVDMFGKDKLLSAPCFRVDEQGDGGGW